VLIKWQFSVRKCVDIEPGLVEVFENVTGVRFFETRKCRYNEKYLINDNHFFSRERNLVNP